MMGKYYGVTAIEQKGTEVRNYYGMGEKPRVRDDEALIFILSNGLYEIAIDVTDNDEFKYFYNQYAMGFFLSYKLYRINKNDLADCPDEGRRYINS